MSIYQNLTRQLNTARIGYYKLTNLLNTLTLSKIKVNIYERLFCHAFCTDSDNGQFIYIYKASETWFHTTYMVLLPLQWRQKGMLRKSRLLFYHMFLANFVSHCFGFCSVFVPHFASVYFALVVLQILFPHLRASYFFRSCFSASFAVFLASCSSFLALKLLFFIFGLFLVMWHLNFALTCQPATLRFYFLAEFVFFTEISWHFWLSILTLRLVLRPLSQRPQVVQRLY